jgi:leader peptidase (prepilin peptidase)/N-methyltransferase
MIVARRTAAPANYVTFVMLPGDLPAGASGLWSIGIAIRGERSAAAMLEQDVSTPIADAADTSGRDRGFRPNFAVIVVGVFAVAASIAADQGVAGLFGAVLALIMLAIAVSDARSFLIPDPLNAAGVVLGLANAAVLGQGDLAVLAEAALRAVIVTAAFLGLRLAYARLRRRQGIGLGDVKLAAVAGIWLDWTMLPVAIEIAALSALAAFALRRYALGHRLRANMRMPFGLFFAPAIWIGWLLQTAVLPLW